MKTTIRILALILLVFTLTYSDCEHDGCGACDAEYSSECNRCASDGVLSASECADIWCD